MARATGEPRATGTHAAGTRTTGTRAPVKPRATGTGTQAPAAARTPTSRKEAARVASKREREKRMVTEMIALYCRALHGTRPGELCPECAELAAYAQARSDRCPFMETKTFCSNCRVHCYKPEMREKIRAVMRFAGPRMIFHHPIAAVRHVIETKAEKKRLEKENRS